MVRKRSNRSDGQAARSSARPQPAVNVSIVAMAASAGGLEPLRVILSSLPADSGMSFVVVQHLHPTHESRLADLLALSTGMTVAQVLDGVRPGPNCVYVIPLNAAIALRGGAFVVSPRSPGRGIFMPADRFSCLLAEDAAVRRTIAVILSGTGHDGARGTRGGQASRWR